MNLSQAIIGLYPNLDPLKDFEVSADADGKQYISAWNNPNPKPTDADLARGWFEWNKRSKRNEFTNRMHKGIRNLYSEVSEVDGAWVAEVIIDMVSDPRGVRVSSVKSLRDKRVRGHGNVDSKTYTNSTAEQVVAMKWEDQ